ncbi:putative kinase [Oxalobacteraceae bacterium GrIS 1.11]
MLLRNLLLVVTLGVGALPLAQAAAHVAAPANVSEVRQVMRLAAIDKIVLLEMRRGVETRNRSKPDSVLDIDIYLTFATSDAIIEHMAPIYANYLSRDYAQKLIVALQTPTGKLATRLKLIQFESGQEAVQAAFNQLPASERSAVNAFNNSVTYTSLINTQLNAKDESGAMFSQWTSEVLETRVKQVNHEIADILEKELRMDASARSDFANSAMPAPHLSRTGMRAFDQEAQAALHYMRRSALLARQFDRENRQLNLKSVLEPANLISREGLEAGNLTILSAENMYGARIKAYDTLALDYERNIQNILMPAEQRQRLSAQNASQKAKIFDIQVRQSERLGTFFQLEKQLLTFCENRLGKITIGADKMLQFGTDEDATSFNTLLAQIRKEDEELQGILKEDNDRRKQAVDSVRASR